MSQSTLPLGGAAEAVEQEPEEAAPRRGRILVLGALAAVALAGGGALLLTGGSEDVVLAASPAVPAGPAAGPAAGPTTTPTAPADGPVDAGRARDPFEALYVPPPAGAARPAGEVPLSAPVVAPAPAQPAQPAEGSAVPQAVPQAGPPVAGAPGGPAVGLALTRVEGPGTARRAVFVLDGEPVTAGVGDSFGTDLLLLSVQQGPADGQWTAVVQSGAGEPFDVVSGAPPVSL